MARNNDRTGRPPADERRFLNVPYDFRPPTLARMKQRWWNADDRRVFVPKMYGWGYDINLGAIAGKFRRKS